LKSKLDRKNPNLYSTNYYQHLLNYTRTRKKEYSSKTGFILDDINYDPYLRDIALVEIYFMTPFIFKYKIMPSMNWIYFFSNIGGFLGLLMGMGIVSILEITALVVNIVQDVFSRHIDLFSILIKRLVSNLFGENIPTSP